MRRLFVALMLQFLINVTTFNEFSFEFVKHPFSIYTLDKKNFLNSLFLIALRMIVVCRHMVNIYRQDNSDLLIVRTDLNNV